MRMISSTFFPLLDNDIIICELVYFTILPAMDSAVQPKILLFYIEKEWYSDMSKNL